MLLPATEPATRKTTKPKDQTLARRRKKGRNVNGILLLDKPLGISSNNALQKTRWLFNAQKAGHTGSLDPLASGMLPVCFGEATKISAYLLDSDKGYTTIARLGEISSTGDAEGEITPTGNIPDFSRQEVLDVLKQFTGNISQIPPMHSALKHNGKPLYKLARKGIEIKRPARQVTIHQLELLEQAKDSLTLSVTCSKGTYIRTLVEDIGNALGCGAYVAMLRRTHVSPFEKDKMINMEELEALHKNEQLDSILLPVDSGLRKLPEVRLDTRQANNLLHGLKIPLEAYPSGFSAEQMFRIYNDTNMFLGLGQISSNGLLAPRRIMVQQT